MYSKEGWTMSAAWELRFKACSAIAAVCTAGSIVIGGAAALHTAQSLKDKELRQHEYNQKREIYYELVDAAAGVSSSIDKSDAEKNAARFWRLYFGKAHIAVMDDNVYKAKKQFGRDLVKVMEKGTFPTEDLEGSTLALSRACQSVLLAQNLFGPSGPPPAKAASKPGS
jgi:hypothetical protein